MTLFRIQRVRAAFFAAALATAAVLASAAEPVKELHYISPAAETSLDPAIGRDLYTAAITQPIFETLYTYDYMARPAKVVPSTATAMPEISADGKTYTIHLKKGIYFTDDPAFGGKRRELTMQDYVYSWERFFDPRLASPDGWLFEGKIDGLDAAVAAAGKANKFDYDSKVAGFEVVDRYTLRLHLTHPDFNLAMILAHYPTGAVAREVVRKYGDSKTEVASHPVGTGVYKLGEWVRGSKIVLEENKDHRAETWDFQAGSDPDDQRIVAQMKGKKIPQIGRIVISVMLEDQSRWLAFQSGDADLFWLDGPLALKAIKDGKLLPELTAKGVQLSRIADPEISYFYWNMQDPVLGGFSKEKIALRRAIAMAHNIDEEISVIWNGQAVKLDYPIPPGVVGYDPNYRSLLQYDPDLANKLLDKYGYKIGADGFRTLPDGKPLVLHYASRNESNGVLQAEMWRKTYNRIHIHMTNDRMIFTDILKEEKNCRLQSRTAPWLADYPDGDNFMQLFYGGNIHQNNNGCFRDPNFDKWYQATQKLPDGPERDALYHQMARQLEVDGGALIGYARYRNMLADKAVLGYKKHPILTQEFQYIDIDRSKK